MKKNKTRLISMIGMAAAVGGTVITMISDWTKRKELESMMDEKIEQAFAEYEEEQEEEP